MAKRRPPEEKPVPPPPNAAEMAQAAYDRDDLVGRAERLANLMRRHADLKVALAKARNEVAKLKRQVEECGWDVGLASTALLRAAGPKTGPSP